ncbi:MAG TPA: glycosyltransferase [Candidatus Polarisedimenticolaceae bacterium]|nr:glycosyltransferase [Candidatus Polarisedimenticolaceae bacterium]
MPTAIREVELTALPEALTGLEGYAHVHVLARLRGRPVHEAVLPVHRGCVGRDVLVEHLVSGRAWALWEEWLQRHLGMDDPSPAPYPITVAVCTRERPDDLRRALQAIERLPDDGQEVLVVDNHPQTDRTRAVVSAFPGVRYLREDRPGLDAARNRALRAARSGVVAFTDDDALPDPGWLRGLLGGFQHPLVLAVTGLTLPAELETPAQEWFERHRGFGRGFCRRVFHHGRHNPLVAGPVGAGANMALRTDVLDRVGPFDEALDAGTLTRSGGDHDMFTRILAAGYRIAYEPGALSRHRHRRDWVGLRATLYGYGVGVYAAWTRALLVEGEWSVPALAWGWFRHEQLPALLRGLRRTPGSAPPSLVLAELRGCLMGPLAYVRARRRLRAGVA